jgi:hypothetical protein
VPSPGMTARFNAFATAMLSISIEEREKRTGTPKCKRLGSNGTGPTVDFRGR